jgi:hypothetical protein
MHNGAERRERMVRIVVSAGHENIEQLTGAKGVIDPEHLRHDTGANGELAWNVAWANALVALLQAANIDAVRTDAIYHDDVYDQDADLVVVGHCDGTEHKSDPQHCMAATVTNGHPEDGIPSADANNRADAFVATWQAIYPGRAGITQLGTITDNMTGHYAGKYRTANTPMVLIEHCVTGYDPTPGETGIRDDAPTAQAGAEADFAALAQFFRVIDGISVGEGFWQIYNTVANSTDARHRIFGRLLAGEHDATLTKTDGTTIPVTAATFERLTLIWDRGISTPPWDVRVPLTGESVA